MEQTVYSKEKGLPFILLKALVRMKLTVFILLFGCFQASAFVHAQSITLSLNKAPFPSFIKEVEAQTGYRFVYLKEQMEKARVVTLHVINSPLLEVLSLSFKNQPLDFTIEDKLIIIRNKKLQKPVLSVAELRGRVVNREGEPMAGVSIRLKDGSRATVTDESGGFMLREIDGSAILEISGAEIEKMEVPVNGRQYLIITVKAKVSNLDQVIVMAYGQTTQRLNTGNIVKVTAEEIERQPVSNPLAALQGRVPGMVVTQTSGIPGSAFKVEIRGRSSLDLSLSRNDPLFIIDGVPFEQGNSAMNQLVSAANRPFSEGNGGLSPLNSLNPSDIESIEVLKDADATSIYGSRGANGVILITTKKNSSLHLKIGFNIYRGVNQVSKFPKMLNREQYMEMRREAFQNDNRAITLSSAPDLMRWDTTRYTDFKDYLIGRSAFSDDAQLSLSAGGKLSFRLNAGLHKEDNIFSKKMSDRRISLRSNVNYRSQDTKLNLSFNTYYATERNNMIRDDLSQYVTLPPNFLLYDSLGNPSFIENGAFITNVSNFVSTPAADLLKKYKSSNDILSGNFIGEFFLSKQWSIRLNGGYNIFITDELQVNPVASISPLYVATANSNFAKSSNRNWIVEPHTRYQYRIKNHSIDFLLGASFQGYYATRSLLAANGYTNELLLYTPGGATEIRVSDYSSQYRYSAVFGRLTYNISDKYILNSTVRRDGSSRFGPGKRFATFSSLAGAWIFSNENFFSKKLPFISHGKLRVSYGTSGNDQIGDYNYLDLWNINRSLYQNNPALVPFKLFNPGYNWEKNKKFESALELSFFRDKIFISGSYFRNRSSNQLIHYQLPIQTGFSSVVKNLPALVENGGWEFVISSRIINTSSFSWNSAVNITFSYNKLVSFPGLKSSSYAYTYEEGKSLSSFWGYKYLGVNPKTGIYDFRDENGDGIISADNDYKLRGSLDPTCYGGINNSFRIKNFSIDIFFEGKVQKGLNYLGSMQYGNPGQAINQPAIVLKRWQKEGDISPIQKFTSRPSGPTGTAGANLKLSDGIYSDASFLRLKNLSIGYKLRSNIIKNKRALDMLFYISSQNLWILSRLKEVDPEIQIFYVLPPLRTIAAGIKIDF